MFDALHRFNQPASKFLSLCHMAAQQKCQLTTPGATPGHIHRRSSQGRWGPAQMTNVGKRVKTSTIKHQNCACFHPPSSSLLQNSVKNLLITWATLVWPFIGKARNSITPVLLVLDAISKRSASTNKFKEQDTKCPSVNLEVNSSAENRPDMS